MSSVATERRPPSQHSFPLSVSHNNNTIINDNEFPTLGARGTASSGGFSPLPTTSGTHTSQSPLPGKERNYATLMRGVDPSMSNPEFQIQNEDFPALPGAVAGSDLMNHSTQSSLFQLSATSEMLSSAGQTVDSQNGTKPPEGSGATRGIITHPDGEVSNIPPSMLADQFGMAGLVTYLRTVDNPSIVSLALGYDLTTLGLNLNLSEQLYTTFGGPWADNPVRPHELDVKVPEEYMTNAHIRDKLPPVKLNKLSEDVLFYLFYNCPGEVYQLAAACELYSRDWRFHKGDGIWLTRSQYGGVKEQTTTYEKGQYNVFDPLQWRKIPKELKLEYKELEEKAKLPAAFGATGTLTAQRPAS
ncbi:unnamed protein product [Auanema sp. JU1783]|nr:unnamed protein product [Auanema sp. JU1783]